MSHADLLTLPEAALAEYLQHHVDGFRGPLTASKFKDGQSNPTYRIDAASGTYVLRRKPPGKLLASAHAVDREFRVLSALHGHGVPVAAPLHLCRDEAVIGSMFYIMQFMPGRVLFNPALPEIEPPSRAKYFDAMLDTLIAIHRVDVAAVGLAEYGKPGNYFARQIARWTEQYRASETEVMGSIETLIAWLPTNMPPEDDRVALVHGDFRIDNMIWDTQQPKVSAVVDWELSTLGHPLADLSYLCMTLRLPPRPLLPGLGDLDRASLGIPTEAQLIARFTAATGIDPGPHWSFYLAFHFFRYAAIAQGVLKRALQGNASSERAMTAGSMARKIAEIGVQVTQGA